MRSDDPIQGFVALAEEVVAELEDAIQRDDRAYPNADVAVENVRRWLGLARRGELARSYYPNFGISRSSLHFGPVEERMVRLETIYVEEILDHAHFESRA